MSYGIIFLKIQAFWHVTLCRLAKRYGSFQGAQCNHM